MRWGLSGSSQAQGCARAVRVPQRLCWTSDGTAFAIADLWKWCVVTAPSQRACLGERVPQRTTPRRNVVSPKPVLPLPVPSKFGPARLCPISRLSSSALADAREPRAARAARAAARSKAHPKRLTSAGKDVLLVDDKHETRKSKRISRSFPDAEVQGGGGTKQSASPVEGTPPDPRSSPPPGPIAPPISPPLPPVSPTPSRCTPREKFAEAWLPLPRVHCLTALCAREARAH